MTTVRQAMPALDTAPRTRHFRSGVALRMRAMAASKAGCGLAGGL